MAHPRQSSVLDQPPTATATVAPAAAPPIVWLVADRPVAYEEACAFMAERVAAIAAGTAPEAVWLLEHPPLYTAGTSARPEDLVAPARLPAYRAGRGGHYTYHGPGQRVAYVMLDVKRRFGDVRAYVAALEAWIIDALALLGVRGERWPGRIGVWVSREAEDGAGAAGPREKIAAIGVRLSRWVSSHGIALNVAPELRHFAGIVPCGISDAGVTSLAALGRNVGLGEVDRALRTAFERRFGVTLADTMTASGAAANNPHPGRSL
ncbi:MAG: lipoyl(octanoyl) transferase LipB [Hyphomicrobiaceae bacterium]|nr:lipoyl(octanoyl) transferase LipB [Hyphomicrobiaceae bacterium]